MADFDKKHHELQSLVNRVIYHAPTGEFTMNDLVEMLKNELPKDASSGDTFYATELLKGTVHRLVLCDSIRKIDDVFYAIKES